MSNLKLNSKEKKYDEIVCIRNRLDIIIYFLVKYYFKEDKVTKKQMISDFKEIGLNYSEIANILSKTKSYVSSVSSKIKKENKKNE